MFDHTSTFTDLLASHPSIERIKYLSRVRHCVGGGGGGGGGGGFSPLSHMQLCNKYSTFISYTSSILPYFTTYNILHATIIYYLYPHVIGTSSTSDTSTSNLFITSLSVRCPKGLITATIRPKIVFIGPIE